MLYNNNIIAQHHHTNNNPYINLPTPNLNHFSTQVLVVPFSITDDVLVEAARFRSRQRIPTLCWRSKVNGCTISRCSQPLVGTFGYRIIELWRIVLYTGVLVVSCFMWSATLESSCVLLSYQITSLASHMTNILISTLFWTNRHHWRTKRGGRGSGVR